MTIEFDGDITKVDTQYIVHQCNCVTSRSAHLAKTVFSAFPYADIYSERQLSTDYRNLPDGEKPGDIIVRGNGKDQRYVINALGQVFPGSPKFPGSKLDGHMARQLFFSECLNKISKISNIESIAFPYGIGCGAAGGDWSAYYKMIQNFSNNISGSIWIVKWSS